MFRGKRVSITTAKDGHAFNKYSLSIYYVPSTGQATEDAIVKETVLLPLWNLNYYEEKDNKPIKMSANGASECSGMQVEYLYKVVKEATLEQRSKWNEGMMRSS